MWFIWDLWRDPTSSHILLEAPELQLLRHSQTFEFARRRERRINAGSGWGVLKFGTQIQRVGTLPVSPPQQAAYRMLLS